LPCHTFVVQSKTTGMRRILLAHVVLSVMVMMMITMMFGPVGVGAAHLVWQKSDAGHGWVHLDHSSQTIYVQRETHQNGKGASSRSAVLQKNLLYSVPFNVVVIVLTMWKFPAQPLPGKSPLVHHTAVGLSAASQGSTDVSSGVSEPTLLWAAILASFLAAGVVALVSALLLRPTDSAELEPIRVTLARSTSNRSQKLKRSRVHKRAMNSSMYPATLSGSTSSSSSERSSVVHTHEASIRPSWVGNSRSSDVRHQTGNIGDSRLEELEPWVAEGPSFLDSSIVSDICPVSCEHYSLCRITSMQSDISAISKVSCIDDHLSQHHQELTGGTHHGRLPREHAAQSAQSNGKLTQMLELWNSRFCPSDIDMEPETKPHPFARAVSH